jgi:uncharacterized protein (TIGR00369 family)
MSNDPAQQTLEADRRDIPDGYTLMARPSNFNSLCGPYYEKIENGIRVGMGLRIEDKHLNQRDITHGGMLMALADNAMGDAAARAYQGKAGLVTVSMNSEFMKAAQLGDWVEARPMVHKRGRNMAFVECQLCVDGRAIFRASGIFAVVERRD